MQNKKKELSPSMETASAALAARCYDDPDFAQRLRENPRAVIEEACGKKLPESLAIEVHENDGRTWHLPVSGGQTTDKLSDEQLKSVSGGVEIIWTTLIVGISVGVAGAAVTGAAIGAAQAP